MKIDLNIGADIASIVSLPIVPLFCQKIISSPDL